MRLAILFLLAFSMPAWGQKWANIISEKVELRGTPSGEHVVTQLSKGTLVEIYRETALPKETWLLVQAPDDVGWLPADTIEVAKIFSTGDAGEKMPEPRVPFPTVLKVTVPTKPTREYIRGTRGGCYYLNSSGKKTYVDRALCG